jgi:predicted nucleotidyltransferase
MRPPARRFGSLAQPLDDLLGTPARVRVLRALDRATHPMLIVQLKRETGLTYQTVQKAVAALTESGLVVELPAGQGTIHGLNRKHPFAPALSTLFEAERVRRRSVAAAVAEWVEAEPARLRSVWLLGSAARGDDTFASKVELGVVATVREDAERLATELEDRLVPVARRQAIHHSVVPFHGERIVALHDDHPGEWASLVRDVTPLHGPSPEVVRALLG